MVTYKRMHMYLCAYIVVRITCPFVRIGETELPIIWMKTCDQKVLIMYRRITMSIMQIIVKRL